MVLCIVSLPQKDCHELLRQERLLEIRERQSDYLWAAPSTGDSCLPGQIRAQAIKELPVNEQLEAEKYAGMPWDIDPTTIETLLPFLAGIRYYTIHCYGFYGLSCWLHWLSAGLVVERSLVQLPAG